MKIDLFSPWYRWKIAELALNNNHSLQYLVSECMLFTTMHVALVTSFIRADILSQIEYVFSSNHMGVKFEELSSHYKLLFMFSDYGYDISAEMCKELDFLTKLLMWQKIDLEN